MDQDNSAAWAIEEATRRAKRYNIPYAIYCSKDESTLKIASYNLKSLPKMIRIIEIIKPRKEN